MTPAELQTFIDGKVKIQNMYRDSLMQHIDRIHAVQTANLMYVQGKIVEKPIEPETCMAFNWDKKNHPPITEMTEEDMENFDRCMDTHRGKHDG